MLPRCALKPGGERQGLALNWEVEKEQTEEWRSDGEGGRNQNTHGVCPESDFVAALSPDGHGLCQTDQQPSDHREQQALDRRGSRKLTLHSGSHGLLKQ